MAPDKYKHLAPHRSRSCHTSDGQPKVRYVEPAARERAAEFEGYHAYECPECGFWHCGREPLREETDG